MRIQKSPVILFYNLVLRLTQKYHRLFIAPGWRCTGKKTIAGAVYSLIRRLNVQSALWPNEGTAVRSAKIAADNSFSHRTGKARNPKLFCEPWKTIQPEMLVRA
jgi:hypothetical protein